MEDHIRKHREQLQANIHSSYNLQKSEDSDMLQKSGESNIDYTARLVAMAKRKDPDRLTDLGKTYLEEGWQDLEKGGPGSGRKEGNAVNNTSEKFDDKVDRAQSGERTHDDMYSQLSYLEKKQLAKDHQPGSKEHHEATKKLFHSKYFKKSEENISLEGIPSPGLYEQNRIASNIQKSFSEDQTTPLSDILEKGGKRAQNGEVRMWGKDKWVKHEDGWVNVSKTGKATLERPGGKREAAGEHHISHHNTHIERHRREVKSAQDKEISDHHKTAHIAGSAALNDKDFQVHAKFGDNTGSYERLKKNFKDFPKQNPDKGPEHHVLVKLKNDSTYTEGAHAIMTKERAERAEKEGKGEVVGHYDKDGNYLDKEIEDPKAHEKRGFDPSKGDEDVTDLKEKVPEKKREKTIMQETGGDESWNQRARAVHLAKYLGKDKEYVKDLDENSPPNGSLILAKLRGLESEYMSKEDSTK